MFMHFFIDRMQCDGFCLTTISGRPKSVGGCVERSRPRSATGSHSLAVDRTPNQKWTLYHWVNRRPCISRKVCK